MFCKLGEIEFDLITYFDSLSESNSYNYAEHPRINNKPMLQYLGENLQEQSIKFNLHSSFCTPEDEIKKLKDCAQKALPLKFIKGNGEYIGVYVITDISNSTEMADAEGNLISAILDVKLKEWTGKVPEDKKQNQGLRQR